MADPTLARDLMVAVTGTAIILVGFLALAIMAASRFEDEWDDVHRDRKEDSPHD